MAAEVTAFPDQAWVFLLQQGRHRATLEGAASIAFGMGADQSDDLIDNPGTGMQGGQIAAFKGPPVQFLQFLDPGDEEFDQQLPIPADRRQHRTAIAVISIQRAARMPNQQGRNLQLRSLPRDKGSHLRIQVAIGQRVAAPSPTLFDRQITPRGGRRPRQRFVQSGRPLGAGEIAVRRRGCHGAIVGYSEPLLGGGRPKTSGQVSAGTNRVCPAMHDFPPVVPGFPQRLKRDDESVNTGRLSEAEAGQSGLVAGDLPDTRSPAHFLRWMIRGQGDVLAVAVLVGLGWFLPGALGPFLVGRAIDYGIKAHDAVELTKWSLLLLVLIIFGGVFGVLMHTLAVRGWLIALYRTTKLVTRKTTQMGHVLPQRAPTGEILSVSAGDSDQFGALMECIGRAISAFLAYILVACIVLATSVKLGLIVLVAAPVLVGVAMPLLKPLQRRQATERNRASELTSMATDIVAGLRILRGIGGERTFGQNYADQSQRVRQAGVSAGVWQAMVDSTSVLFSGLFLVTLTWLGAQEVAAGTLTVGRLVSFFGYALFMVWPIQTFFELAQKWVRSLISAHKTVAILEQQPPWHDPQQPKRLPLGAPISDEQSGFVGQPGLLTVVVSAVPDDSAALADRLGRYLPGDTDPISTDVEEGVKGKAAKAARAKSLEARRQQEARDRAIAERRWGVSVGGVDLSEAALADVRQSILVSDTSSQVFAGTLQSAVDPHGRLTREQAEAVLHTAAAEDVFEAMPGGWQGRIDERGRGLSGGQRQRLVLARALAADPEILILVEPTSAVDAHTEAMIAERLAERRRGQTTIVTSVSPLLLHHADQVAFMADGRIVQQGTHDAMLASNPDYRGVVARNLDEEVNDHA